MGNNLVLNNEKIITANANGMLKVTALYYLTDALLVESYEECAELIALAKKFGAGKKEISAVIGVYIEWIKGDYEEDEAYEGYGGRLRV